MEIIIGIIIVYVIYRVIKGAFSSKKQPSAKPEITFQFKTSRPNSFRGEFQRDEKPVGERAKWYSARQSVSVQGYDIAGGLIYVGETLLDRSGYENDACLINPKLKVSQAEPWDGGDEMGYWPQYGRISSRCRGAYLKWLVGGRSEPEANIGYVFLFFYGLERRLFVDGQQDSVPTEERAEIIQEVNRLLKIYGGNRSFRGYASNLLAMEWVLYQSDKPAPNYIDFNDRYCSEPFQVVLAKYVSAGQPIPADVALQWIILHPEFGLRTPTRRCAKEFRELFIHRYKHQFGDGLFVKPNKTPLKLEYRAASSSIRGDLKLKVPDMPNPFILTAPLKKISSLVEECTIELEPYSRFLGRKDNDPNSLLAVALLPSELMQQLPAVNKVKLYLAQVCANGMKIISVESLYQSFGEKVPLQIGKKESESLTALVEGVGFGMAPDIRFHNMKPVLDGKVVIFRNGHGVDFRPSREYRTIGTMLRLGAMVSQIDEDFSPAEEAILQSLIYDNRDLTELEKASLQAFLHWCLNTPQGTAGIKQMLADVSSAEKTAISHILISVAYADGRVDPKEIRQLEKLYSTLGLNKEQVTSDLHTLAAANEPITVSLRDPESSFSIPKPKLDSVNSKGFNLNEELIRIREEETRKVKGVLEGIFSDQIEEVLEIGASVSVSESANPLSSLDQGHQNFFHRLLKQETWERSSLHDLCKELGLMVDGAMEVLNEWAFANANAPLIEDGDPVFVDVNLAREIINVQ
jgi:uncharacterized tellurite resistance protein B-like protein